MDQGDVLTNAVSVSGNILQVSNLTPNGNSEADGSGASVQIARGTLTKSIYAINGSTSVPNPLRVAPGDQVTFRLRYSLPSSDFENFYIMDYLPLPVFLSTQVTGPFSNSICGVPGAGSACLGPADSYHLLAGAIIPTITTDAAGNSVLFSYGDYDINNGGPTQVDILFTVTVRSDPFADGLYLTNQARANEGSTNADDQVTDSIIQIQLTEPVLNIRKGVVATDNPAGVFSPAIVGPVGFSQPGSACPRAAGIINSVNLATNPINSNLSGLDAGDQVTFSVVIENRGTGLTGAFDVRFRDTLPAGFAIPGTGLNLCVTDGTGASMPYSDLGGGLFGTGLELVEPGPTNPDAGALDAYDTADPTDGHNIMILTYDLVLANTITPNQTLTNTATLFNYAGVEGGTDHTNTDLSDSASVQTSQPAIDKSMVSTNQAFTTDPNVAIGEIITYQVVATIPEGTIPNATLTDTLDPGLAFVNCVSVVASSAALSSSNGAWGVMCNPPTNPTLGNVGGGTTNDGRLISYNLGTVTNSNTNNTVAETITLTYRAVVLNTPGNDRGIARNNAATLAWTGGSTSDSAPDVIILEPTLTIQKDASPVTGDAGDTITFTIIVRNQAPSNTDAFNLDWRDTIPVGSNLCAWFVLKYSRAGANHH